METGLVQDWIAGREMTGAVARLLSFRFEGIEFYLLIAAFFLLCFSLHMMMRSMKKPDSKMHLRGSKDFSRAAHKVKRAYGIFAWGFMSLSFMFSILVYLP